jgi:hypothetical protein
MLKLTQISFVTRLKVKNIAAHIIFNENLKIVKTYLTINSHIKKA